MQAQANDRQYSYGRRLVTGHDEHANGQRQVPGKREYLQAATGSPRRQQRHILYGRDYGGDRDIGHEAGDCARACKLQQLRTGKRTSGSNEHKYSGSHGRGDCVARHVVTGLDWRIPPLHEVQANSHRCKQDHPIRRDDG
jgi:hypothetical protein